MPRKAKSNRTDMLTQPIQTATGQKYGAAQASRQTQQAVPLPQGGSAGGGQVLSQAQAFQMPAQLNAPTDRPDEPLTQGMLLGPGAGPEVLDQPDSVGLLIKGLAALQMLGEDADPATKRLIAYAQATLSQKQPL